MLGFVDTILCMILRIIDEYYITYILIILDNTNNNTNMLEGTPAIANINIKYIVDSA
jgi:hypothetical protein